jgi:type VI protein secretion system component VasF
MLWQAERQTSALNAIKTAVWILAGLAVLAVLMAFTLYTV